jgi:hypothetical protein
MDVISSLVCPQTLIKYSAMRSGQHAQRVREQASYAQDHLE